MSCSVKNCDPASAVEINLENMFVAMAKGGDSKADGRSMNQEVLEKWFNKAQVVDSKLPLADVTNSFSKIGKPAITFAEFKQMLTTLAADKKVDLSTLKEKLTKVSP